MARSGAERSDPPPPGSGARLRAARRGEQPDSEMALADGVGERRSGPRRQSGREANGLLAGGLGVGEAAGAAAARDAT